MPSENPLRRLFRYAREYRRDVVWATIYSALNKFFDILPEVLIGMAVDVVVNRKASFLARAGLTEPHAQIVGLAIATVLIWVGESLFRGATFRGAAAGPIVDPCSDCTNCTVSCSSGSCSAPCWAA